MIVDIRPMTEGDATLMAQEIRPMDRFEFEVMSNGKPIEECFHLLRRRSAMPMTALIDGEIAAVWGIVRPTLLSQIGNPWMAATPLIEQRPVQKEFIRHTKRELGKLCGGFTELWNLVYVENEIAIRFIRWIGFELGEERYDINGHTFLKFGIKD